MSESERKESRKKMIFWFTIKRKRERWEVQSMNDSDVLLAMSLSYV